MADISVYVVTEFGCNSSPSDMYPPTTKVFLDKKIAYNYYNKIKARISAFVSDDPDEPNAINVYKDAKGESAIQDCFTVKRPEGVSIELMKVIPSNASSE